MLEVAQVGAFLYILLHIFFPGCVVKCSESHWKSQFEAFCGMKTSWFFPENIPKHS
jgi:hypothetical protein